MKKRLRLVQQVRGHNITSKLTAEHSEEARQKLYRYRAVFEGLKLPLMVQSILTFDFIPRIIELATMYFSQRRPQEPSAFHWVIDAKGDSLEPTEWEAWWSDFIMPAMQSRSFERPMHSLPVGDYSHMKRFEMPMTDFLRAHAKHSDDGSPPMNIQMIIGEDFRFCADPEPGIELVDIITNATRRAIVGNLGIDGWRDIPTLMIHISGPSYIPLAQIHEDSSKGRVYPYTSVLRAFGERGRNMSTPRTMKSRWYNKKSNRTK
jgi:hypothetical protein